MWFWLWFILGAFMLASRGGRASAGGLRKASHVGLVALVLTGLFGFVFSLVVALGSLADREGAYTPGFFCALSAWLLLLSGFELLRRAGNPTAHSSSVTPAQPLREPRWRTELEGDQQVEVTGDAESEAAALGVLEAVLKSGASKERTAVSAITGGRKTSTVAPEAHLHIGDEEVRVPLVLSETAASAPDEAAAEEPQPAARERAAADPAAAVEVATGVQPPAPAAAPAPDTGRRSARPAGLAQANAAGLAAPSAGPVSLQVPATPKQVGSGAEPERPADHGISLQTGGPQSVFSRPSGPLNLSATAQKTGALSSRDFSGGRGRFVYQPVLVVSRLHERAVGLSVPRAPKSSPSQDQEPRKAVKS